MMEFQLEYRHSNININIDIIIQSHLLMINLVAKAWYISTKLSIHLSTSFLWRSVMASDSQNLNALMYLSLSGCRDLSWTGRLSHMAVFIISISWHLAEWVPRMNIPRESWENCVVFCKSCPWVTLHYFCCFHKHVRFKGRNEHPHLSGRKGVSITLSDKGWKISSRKIISAIITWDEVKGGQWCSFSGLLYSSISNRYILHQNREIYYLKCI